MSAAQFDVLIARGEDLIVRAGRLADQFAEGSELGRPSDWIHKDEHVGWIDDATELVRTTFGVDSAELRRWQESSNNGFAKHAFKPGEDRNYYLGYKLLFQKSTDALRSLKASLPEIQRAPETAGLERMARDAGGNLAYIWRSLKRPKSAMILLVLLILVLSMNAKAIKENAEVIVGMFGKPMPSAPVPKAVAPTG